MIKLIKYVIKYQNYFNKTKKYDNEIFEKIVSNLKPIIDNLINNYKIKDNEDIYQEVLLKLNVLILRFKITKHNFNSLYLTKICKKTQNINITYYKYNLYCNQNEFIKYIRISLTNFLIDLRRKEQINTKIVYQDLTLIDNYINDNKFKIEYTLNLTNSQKEFVFLFIGDDGNILTDSQVAKKLGITQQAVNKRKQKIKELLNKK